MYPNVLKYWKTKNQWIFINSKWKINGVRCPYMLVFFVYSIYYYKAAAHILFSFPYIFLVMSHSADKTKSLARKYTLYIAFTEYLF